MDQPFHHRTFPCLNNARTSLPRLPDFICAFAFVQPLGAPPFPRLVIVFGRVHIFQDQRAWIEPAPFALVGDVHLKLFDHVGNFSRAAGESGRDGRAAFAPVNRGERLESAHGLRNDDLPSRADRPREQPFEPRSGKVRKVARDDQVPRQTRCSQGGRNPCQRPAPNSLRSSARSILIRNRAQSHRCIPAGRPYHGYAGNERVDHASRMNDQRNAAKIEKAFVLPHARACAARKNKGSDLAAAFHNRPAILRLVPLLDQSTHRGRDWAPKSVCFSSGFGYST
jgi:hypothetical protein